jgi:hypothetical protein
MEWMISGEGKNFFSREKKRLYMPTTPLPSEAKGANPQRHVCRPFPRTPIPFQEKRSTLENTVIYRPLPSEAKGAKIAAARLPQEKRNTLVWHGLPPLPPNPPSLFKKSGVL